ncbi:MAG TPA: winged helix-turn-helix domain-containing protein [Vitreimonas sp.]|nr:winged helix-turn-helix domain-containing protein [Vitreimonas sp.]
MSASEPVAILDLGGGYMLDTLSHTLTQDGRAVQLSPLASRLVQVLARRRGELVERGDIIDVLWKGDWGVGDPALSRLVSEVRSAAGDDAKRPMLIQTVPRRGYRLVSAVASPSAPPAGAPWWPTAWRLANRSLLILVGGFALILALAIVARLAR